MITDTATVLAVSAGPAAAEQARKRGCAKQAEPPRSGSAGGVPEVVRCQLGSKPGQQRREQGLVRITPCQPLAG